MLEAEDAKAAILALIRADSRTFVGSPDLDQLTSLPLIERAAGEFTFGAFILNVEDRWYAANIGEENVHSYHGTFEWRDSVWTATMPVVTRFHERRQ